MNFWRRRHNPPNAPGLSGRDLVNTSLGARETPGHLLPGVLARRGRENVLPSTTAVPAPLLLTREFDAWPTATLQNFRDDLSYAFERARDAGDQEAVDAALRIVGRVETELASRRSA